MITACLLNWRRPENLPTVIDSLRNQSVPVRIYLWNNGQPLSEDVASRLDWYVNSGHNVGPCAQWWMAYQATTPYVCMLDDDLALSDSHVLRDELALMQNEPETALGGPFGVCLGRDQAYASQGARWLNPDEGEVQPVDVLKGRHIVARTEPVQRAMQPINETDEDIAICGIMAGGQLGQHRWLPLPWNRFQSLPEPHPLNGHNNERLHLRTRASQRWFGPPQPRERGGVWLLTNQRSGSNMLCRLLNHAGLKPELGEYYNPRETGWPDWPRNNKVQPRHLSLKGLTIEDVQRRLPDTRYVVLRREDLVAATVSQYIAKQLDLWRVPDTWHGEARRLTQACIPVRPDVLLATYREMVADDRHWPQELARTGIDRICLTYEQLLTEPRRVLGRVAKHCRLELDIEHALSHVHLKVQRSLNPTLYDQCYRALLAALGHRPPRKRPELRF
jgi:LPS sulfotransferase NodH